MEVVGPLIVIAVVLLLVVIVARLLREWILLGIAALFLAIAATRLVSGAGALDMTIVYLVTGVVLHIMFLLVRGDAKRKRFLTWLANHEGELRAGTLLYNGHLITLDTPITSFQACVSAVLASFRFHSQYFFRWQSSKTTRTAFTAVTCLLGWWGLPEGPLWTVQAIQCNAGGGDQTTLRHLILMLSSP